MQSRNYNETVDFTVPIAQTQAQVVLSQAEGCKTTLIRHAIATVFRGLVNSGYCAQRGRGGSLQEFGKPEGGTLGGGVPITPLLSHTASSTKLPPLALLLNSTRKVACGIPSGTAGGGFSGVVWNSKIDEQHCAMHTVAAKQIL